MITTIYTLTIVIDPNLYYHDRYTHIVISIYPLLYNKVSFVTPMINLILTICTLMIHDRSHLH